MGEALNFSRGLFRGGVVRVDEKEATIEGELTRDEIPRNPDVNLVPLSLEKICFGFDHDQRRSLFEAYLQMYFIISNKAAIYVGAEG